MRQKAVLISIKTHGIAEKMLAVKKRIRSLLLTRKDDFQDHRKGKCF
jgi:hypothetical protein